MRTSALLKIRLSRCVVVSFGNTVRPSRKALRSSRTSRTTYPATHSNVRQYEYLHPEWYLYYGFTYCN